MNFMNFSKNIVSIIFELSVSYGKFPVFNNQDKSAALDKTVLYNKGGGSIGAAGAAMAAPLFSSARRWPRPMTTP